MKILHFQFQLLVHVFSMVLGVYNVTDIQGFGVEYVVVFAKKNNNYVETKMGIVKRHFGQLFVVILLLTSLNGIFVELL